MQTDNNATNAPDSTQASNTTAGTATPDLNTVFNYQDSPHKGINPADVVPSNEGKPEGLLFGKYKTQEDAQKGYQNAEAKIREQGAELNKMKEQYKPMEDYSEETWSKKIESWKADKSLPESLTYDPAIPEINMLLKGFEKAGVSEKQAKDILAGAVERQEALIKEKQESIKQELGPEGMKKVQALNTFGSKLSHEDATIFASLFAFPYVEASQVDLMHRLLCGQTERNIPTGTSAAPVSKASVDIYKEIMTFQEANKNILQTDAKAQERLNAMWIEYGNAQKKGL